MRFNSYIKFVPFLTALVERADFTYNPLLVAAQVSLLSKLEAMTKEFRLLSNESSGFVVDPSFTLIEFKFNQLAEGVHLYNEVNRCYSVVDIFIFNAKIDEKGNKFKTSEVPLIHFQMSESEFSSLILQTNGADYSAGTLRSLKGEEVNYDRNLDPITGFLKDKIEYASNLEQSSARFFAEEFLGSISNTSERIPSEAINRFLSSLDNYTPQSLINHSNFSLGAYRSAVTSVLTKTGVDALFYAKALKENLIDKIDSSAFESPNSLEFLNSIEVDNFSEIERLVLCISFSEMLLSNAGASFPDVAGHSFKVENASHPRFSDSFRVVDSVTFDSGELFCIKKPVALLSSPISLSESYWSKSNYSAYDQSLFSKMPYLHESSIVAPVAFQLNILEKAKLQVEKSKERFKKHSVLDSEYSDISWLAIQAFSKYHSNAVLFGGPCSRFVTFELSFAHSITERNSDSGCYQVSEGVSLCSFSIGTHELLKALRGMNVSVPASLNSFGHMRFDLKSGNNSLNRLLNSQNKTTLNSVESSALMQAVSIAKEAASEFKRSQTKKAKEALISSISNLLSAKSQFESELLEKNKSSIKAVSDQAISSFNSFLESQLKDTGINLEDISSIFSKNLLK